MTQPNKDLGQHWLNDSASLQAVLDIAEVSSDDTVVEIGSGQGSLTKLLVERAAKVVAVEFDKNLAKQLSARVQSENLEVITADIRTFNFSEIDGSFKVVGNIPYYLTSHLIQLLLELDTPPVAIGLLVQKEVAERVAAEAGQHTILSVTTQLLAEVSLGPVVPAELFEPPPKVDSQVLGLKLKSKTSKNLTMRVVKLGFSQRRKQLKNTLAGALRLEKSEVLDTLDACEIKPKARPQALTLDKWRQLTAELENRGYV